MLDFTFVGIGQCGNKLADAFASQKNKAVAINTTQKDMNCLVNIPKSNLITIEATGTKGGAGKVPKLGEKAMSEHMPEVLEKINDIGKDSDYIVLCAGMGGGTGSGGTPPLLKELLKQNRKIMLIMTLPDKTEGVEVQINAFNSCISILKIIEQYSIPYIIIENDKIKERMKTSNNFDWRSVNDSISRIFTQFNKTANKNSPYSTFDETDYKKTLHVQGMMSLVKLTINMNDINNENSLRDMIKQAWEKENFFADFDYSTARIITTIIDAPDIFLENKENYKLIETSLLKLRDACGTVSPYQGIYPYDHKQISDKKYKLVVYCMLTGLKPPMEKLQTLRDIAKAEQEAMQNKAENNKIDFSEFSLIGGAFNSPKKIVSNFEEIETSAEDDLNFL